VINKPKTFRLALSQAWPGLRYLAMGAWAAWLFLISSGATWISDVEVNGMYPAYLMFILSITSSAVCFAATRAQSFFESFLNNRTQQLAVALIAATGGIGIVLAGPYYLNVSWPFWVGTALVGVYSGVFSIKCGQVFGALSPRRVLVYALLSELIMVALSYAVLANSIFHPISGGPPLAGILAIAFLPVISMYLVSLPNADSEEPEESGRSRDASARLSTASPTPTVDTAPESKPSIGDFPKILWKFLLVIFVFTLASETVRSYFLFSRLPAITYIDTILVLLLRLTFAILFLIFALRARAKLNFSRIYLLSLVAVAVIIALLPLLQNYGTPLGALIGFVANIMNLLIWCLLAFVVFEKKVSPIMIFGYGRSALLLGQAVGWMLGIWMLPLLTGTVWEFVCYLGLAFCLLVVGVLFFTEKQFDQLFGELLTNQIYRRGLFQNNRSTKAQRPWIAACERAGSRVALSTREQEVFVLLASGRSPESIAKTLVLSLNTVRTHTRNIYTKFDVHSKTELVGCVEAILDETKAPEG